MNASPRISETNESSILVKDPGRQSGVCFLPPINRQQFFDQKSEKSLRRAKLTSPLPDLQQNLRYFVSDNEMGVKFTSHPNPGKPEPFLTTKTLNERIASKSRASFLTNLELHHHYQGNIRLYYVNRGDSKYIYPYMDCDNQPHTAEGDSGQAVRRLIQHYNLDAYTSPTDRGHGFYFCIDVSRSYPEEINTTLHAFADACNHLIITWGLKAKVEAKALPSIRHPINNSIIKRGLLGRLPVFECLEDYESFLTQRMIPLADVARLAGLGATGNTEGPSQAVPDTRTRGKPKKTPRRAGGKATRKTSQPTPAEQPDSWLRMVSNAYHFGETHGRPPTSDELLDYYNSGPSADGDEIGDRESRAARVVSFLTSRWINRTQCGPEKWTGGDEAHNKSDLALYADQLSQIPVKDRKIQIGKKCKKRRYNTLDQYELSLIVAVATHNFFNNENHRTPRSAIEQMWIIAHSKGLVSRSWKNEHYTAGIEVLVNAGWLEIAVPDNNGNGRARCLCPGVAHPDQRKALPIRERVVADFEATETRRLGERGYSS